MKFFILKRKKLLAIVFCFLFLTSVILSSFYITDVFSPKIQSCIVIDAGHGGIDAGAVGVETKITESELNLKYANCLKKICEEYGFKVIMTRKDMSGLYSVNAKNKKDSEMKKRNEIINSSNADFLISIHMNKFSAKTARGVHTFYAKNNEGGKLLAESIQNTFIQNVDYANKFVQPGDFYILNCTTIPGVLIECGFLSNPDEERLLQNENYMQKLCYNIMCGVLCLKTK